MGTLLIHKGCPQEIRSFYTLPPGQLLSAFGITSPHPAEVCSSVVLRQCYLSSSMQIKLAAIVNPPLAAVIKA